MKLKKHKLIAVTIIAVVFGGTAQAQYYVQPAPLYPYVAQQPQYVYPQPQYAPQPYPYVQSSHVRSVPRGRGARASELSRRTDPVMVEELRHRGHKTKHVVTSDRHKDIEIDKKRIVREKPIVRRHIRVVDDPPIVVQREISEQGQVLSEQRVPAAQAQAPVQLPLPPAGGRVIHAEAEVTILGPDRMNIRLYRKSDGRDANAKALPAKHKKRRAAETPRPAT